MMPARTSILSTIVVASSLLGADALAIQGAPTAPPQGEGNQQQPQSPDGQGGQQGRGGNRQRGQGGQGQQGGGMRFGFGGGGGPGGPGGRMGGGFGALMNRYKADFARRDVPLFKDQLAFDESQMTIVETLINDYDTSFGPASEESQETLREASRRMMQAFMGGGDMREMMRSTRETIQADLEQMEVENGGPLSDEARMKFFQERMTKVGEEMMAQRKATGGDQELKAILQEMFDETTKWAALKAGFKKTVIDGIEGSLNAEQKAKWPAFQRYLRREKSMDNAVLSGEGTNLFVVMDEAGLSQASIDSISKALDDYEIQLDNALVARDEYLESSEPKLMRAVLSGEIPAAKNIAERQITLRKGVREVNDQSRVAIVGVLSAEDGAKFNKAAMEAAFRRVFRQTRATESFAKALELPDLSEEARAAVVSLQSAYLAELGAMNERIVTATRKEEPIQRLAEMEGFLGVLAGTNSPMSMMGRQFGNNTADPVGTLMDERGEMGTKYMEQLRGLLTPEQAEQLPQGRDGGRNAGGFGTGKISELPEQFQAVAKSVDKNKDGTIDDQERGEMFRAMREQGFGPGGPGGRGGQGGPQGDQGGPGGGPGGGQGQRRNPAPPSGLN